MCLRDNKIALDSGYKIRGVTYWRLNSLLREINTLRVESAFQDLKNSYYIEVLAALESYSYLETESERTISWLLELSHVNENLSLSISWWGTSNPLAVYEPTARIRASNDLDSNRNYHNHTKLIRPTFCIGSFTPICKFIPPWSSALPHCPSSPQSRFNCSEYMQLRRWHEKFVPKQGLWIFF